MILTKGLEVDIGGESVREPLNEMMVELKYKE